MSRRGLVLAADGQHPGMRGAVLRTGRFVHEALFYDGDDDLIAQLTPILRDAVDAGVPALVVVAEPKAARLRAALGGRSARIEFADMGVLGRNPGRIISAWEEFVGRHAADGLPMLGVGEPVSRSRRPDELQECHRHEALLNVAFDGGPTWRLICPYDERTLHREDLEAARRTHPIVTDTRGRQPSDAYDQEPAPLEGDLPEPRPPVRSVPFDGPSLARVRRLAEDEARDAGVGQPRSADLVLALHELAANSVVHGGGHGTVRAWRQCGRLIFEVRDAGTMHDPLTGRLRASATAGGGRGVWLANQLCDLVQIRSRAGETVVRITIDAEPRRRRQAREVQEIR